jgi:hypothetical protein
MTYLDQLERLPPDLSLLTPAPRRALLWTGQSAWASAGLSPRQTAFLLAIAGSDATLGGFPFHKNCLDFRDGSLLAASWRNARQTAWSITRPRYRQTLAEALRSAIHNTSERLLVITVSCGLELVNAAGVPLPPKVRVVALGPSCLRPLRLPSVRVIQGKRDGWSRWLYRGPVHEYVPCGHLDYYDCPWTIELLKKEWHS